MKFIASFARRNKLLLISFLLLTWYSSQPQLAFIMLLVAPLAVIYQLIKLAFRWKDSQIRKDRYVALALIAVCVLAVMSSHSYHHKVARSVANKLVKDITSFQKVKGRYPSNGKEVGLADNLRLRPHRLTYYYVEGQPHLFYAATYGPFDKYVYNFSNGVWEYVPD